MKKKGFTLIELLVVIAIIAMLMGILMPALARVRALAQRVVCGSNARSIGTALLVYVNDDEDENMPIGYNWVADPEEDWVVWREDDQSAQATVSSCLYLLIKGEYTTVDQFICKSEGSTPVVVNNFRTVEPATERADDLAEGWDFGNPSETSGKKGQAMNPAMHNSYAYQMPYPNGDSTPHSYPASTGSNSNLAILGDLNPYIQDYKRVVDAIEDLINPDKGYREQNSLSHQQDGQNLLYIDGHVKFMTRPTVGVEDDNVYTYWDSDADGTMDPRVNSQWHEVGEVPRYSAVLNSTPANYDDSLLMNERKPEL